jgi:hypothetical protein
MFYCTFYTGLRIIAATDLDTSAARGNVLPIALPVLVNSCVHDGHHGADSCWSTTLHASHTGFVERPRFDIYATTEHTGTLRSYI